MTKEELADQMVAILFPPLEQFTDGSWLDRSVTDIDGAIYDIERARGHCDQTCLRTLKRVSERLRRAEQIAEPFRAPGIPMRPVDPTIEAGDSA